MRGKKVILRPIHIKDKEHTLRWRNIPEVRDCYLGRPFPITDEMEQRWYERKEESQFPTKIIYAIDSLEGNKFVGFTHLSSVDWVARKANFGIVIGEVENRRKGYGAEAMQLFFNYSFNSLNLEKIYLEVLSSNEVAIKVYEKIGFVVEGILLNQVFINGKYQNVHIMALFRNQLKYE